MKNLSEISYAVLMVGCNNILTLSDSKIDELRTFFQNNDGVLSDKEFDICETIDKFPLEIIECIKKVEVDITSKSDYFKILNLYSEKLGQEVVWGIHMRWEQYLNFIRLENSVSVFEDNSDRLINTTLLKIKKCLGDKFELPINIKVSFKQKDFNIS